MPWLNGGDGSDVAARSGSDEVAVAYKIACNALETSIADSVVVLLFGPCCGRLGGG